MNFNDILSFFLYVIPGFISTEIYRAKYPAKKGSGFYQLTWSIIISIIFISLTRWADSCFKWQLFPTNAHFPRIRTILILIGFAIVFSLLRIAKRELAEKYIFSYPAHKRLTKISI